MPLNLNSLPHFALLDNNYEKNAISYLFEEPIYFIQISDIAEAESALARIEEARQQGLYAAGYFAYEFARAFGYFSKKDAGGDVPLLEFGVFRKKRELDNNQVSEFLESHFGEQLPFTCHTKARICQQEYDTAIKRIKHELEEGNSYQVNYTYETELKVGGCPIRLYHQLRKAQAVPYGALLHFPSQTILSRSPELFFEKTAEQITTRPMKGTEKRDLNDLVRDENLKEDLRSSTKQRAENLMIVDLLRNDLGRIANIGSVRVKKLFSIETYQTVHQMTSTITANVDVQTPLHVILEALFPCGSITGAPKLRTTQIIEELEPTSRGVYCGAIGYINPNNDMTFNVPIRTLMLDKKRNARFHTGGGVVYDSVDAKEYEETQLKGQFLFKLAKEFNALESLLFTPEKGMVFENAHIERLAKTAEFLNYPFDKMSLKKALADCIKPLKEAVKVRIELKPDGEFEIKTQSLDQFDGEKVIYLSKKQINSNDPTFYYKTTNRALFNQELATFRHAHNAYDVLFTNERHEITETSYHNIFLKFGDEYHTPSLDCGLLNGIGRAQFIKDKKDQVIERRITIDELIKADEILLVNSIRGIVSVRYQET